MSKLFPELDAVAPESGAAGGAIHGAGTAPGTAAGVAAGAGARPAKREAGPAPPILKAGPTAIAQLEKLLGLPGVFGYRVRGAQSIAGEELTIDLEGEGAPKTALRLRGPGQPDAFLRLRHLSVGYRGGDDMHPRLVALLKRLALVLRDVPLRPLQKLVERDFEVSTKPRYDIEDSLVFSFASPIGWRNFYEGHELYRGSCQRFSGNVVAVYHTDIECHYAGPRHDNGTVSFFNYLRTAEHETEANATPQRGGTLSLLTDVSDHDVIKGGGTKLDLVLDEVAKLPVKPDVVMVSNACISLITGDDIDASAERLQKKLKVPVISIGNVTSPGVELLRRARGELGFLGVEKRPHSINLVGLPQAPGHEELLALLAATGIAVNCRLLPEIDMEGFRRYMAAELQVFYGWDWNARHYEEITGGLPLPSLVPPSPFGIEGTRRWLQEIACALGLSAEYDRVWRERAQPIVQRFETLRAEARRYRLGFVIAEDEELRRLASDRLMGVPLRPMLEEMGFGIELLLYRADGVKDGTREDGARLFSTAEELERQLRESRAAAFYSEVFFDRRITRTGHAVFSMGDVEMGLVGAVRSLERLLARCKMPFYRRYARHLGSAFGVGHGGGR